MRRPSSRQRRLVILTLSLLAFGLAYYAGSRYKDRAQPAVAITGVAIQPPTPLPILPETEDTSPLQRQSLVGRWSLLMLDPHAGQSRSPALIRLLQIHNRLAAAPELQQRIRFLYLPRELRETERAAIERLGANLHALSGDAQRVDETLRQFGVEPAGEKAALYLIGPGTRLHALFTPDQDIATIAEDLTTLITSEP